MSRLLQIRNTHLTFQLSFFKFWLPFWFLQGLQNADIEHIWHFKNLENRVLKGWLKLTKTVRCGWNSGPQKTSMPSLLHDMYLPLPESRSSARFAWAWLGPRAGRYVRVINVSWWGLKSNRDVIINTLPFIHHSILMPSISGFLLAKLHNGL